MTSCRRKQASRSKTSLCASAPLATSSAPAALSRPPRPWTTSSPKSPPPESPSAAPAPTTSPPKPPWKTAKERGISSAMNNTFRDTSAVAQCLPLTLALSFGERGQHRSGLEHASCARFVPQLTTVLRLPQGEGRGEGEQAVRPGAQSDATLVTPVTHLTPSTV